MLPKHFRWLVVPVLVLLLLFVVPIFLTEPKAEAEGPTAQLIVETNVTAPDQVDMWETVHVTVTTTTGEVITRTVVDWGDGCNWKEGYHSWYCNYGGIGYDGYTATYKYHERGVFTATIRATDESGDKYTATLTLPIGNPPTSVIEDMEVIAPEEVFVGEVFTVTLRWEPGDYQPWDYIQCSFGMGDNVLISVHEKREKGECAYRHVYVAKAPYGGYNLRLNVADGQGTYVLKYPEIRVKVPTLYIPLTRMSNN